jgi:hypothetical protein
VALATINPKEAKKKKNPLEYLSTAMDMGTTALSLGKSLSGLGNTDTGWKVSDELKPSGLLTGPASPIRGKAMTKIMMEG